MAEEFVDVSNWQGSGIDWGAYARAGYRRAACKASEGVGYADPSFRRNWSALAAVGLKRIAYHFARPDLGNSPEAEAEWFWKLVSGAGLKPDDSMDLDIEAGSGNLLSWTQRFMARLAQLTAGTLPSSLLGLYSGNWFLIPHGITGFGPYYLWDSGYPNLPPVPAGWTSIDIHQYTDKASISGIPGGVDCSRILNSGLFSGQEVDLQADERAALFTIKDLVTTVFARTDDTYNGVKYGATLDYGQGKDRTGQPAGTVTLLAAIQGIKPSAEVDVQSLAKAVLDGLSPDLAPAFAKAVVDEIGSRVRPSE